MIEPSSLVAEKTSHGTVDIELDASKMEPSKLEPSKVAQLPESARPSSHATGASTRPSDKAGPSDKAAGQSGRPSSHAPDPSAEPSSMGRGANAHPSSEVHKIGPSSEHPTKSEAQQKPAPSSEVPKASPTSEAPRNDNRTELVTKLPAFATAPPPPATSEMPMTEVNGMCLVPAPIEAYAIKSIARDRNIIRLFWIYTIATLIIGIFMTVFIGAYTGSKCFGNCAGIKQS